MDLLKFYQIGVLIFLFINCSKGQLLLEGSSNRATECEGTVLRGSCPANQVIAVKDIQYGTTTCALNANDPGCCDYDPTDCLTDYTGTTQQAACSGRGLCSDLTIGEEDTSSCGSPYPDLNHYLTMEYYCVPESRIGKMCDDVPWTTTGSPLYIWNNDYPGGAIRAASTICSCSIEASNCNSQIKISFVHFELGDGGGSCSDNQKIEIDDKGIIQTYTCSHNTDYEITAKMTSTSNYITVMLENAAAIGDGRFWIGFDATESNSPLEVSCPSKEQTICKDCPVLTPPTDGNLSTTYVTTGTNVEVLCNSGYTLFGEAILDCQINGTWSAEVGTCQRDCSDLTPPTNGSLSTTDVITGTNVDVLCNSGYTLFGEGTLDCQENGTWSAEVGTCQKDCPDLTPPTNGSLSTIDVITGTNMVVFCNSGYTLFGEGTLDCQENGTWSADVGTCQKDCPDLTPPTNGSLSTTEVTTGTNVDVLCDTGYTLFGEAILDCQANGTWSAEVGTCQKDCPDLTPPANGSLSTTDITTGTSVDVLCDTGYTLFGEGTLDCQTNGTWSAEVGTCQKECDYPTKVGYDLGIPTASTYGSTVSVNSCDTGYTGNPSVVELTCQDNGTWSEATGCIIVDCNIPSIVGYSLGTLSATTYGSTVSVNSCDTGYTGNPSVVELTCQDNGTWSEATGCIIVDCNSPTIIGYTLETLSATTYGSNVTVTACDTGYTGTPTTTELTCQDTGTWSEVTGCTIVGLGDSCTLQSDCSAIAYAICNNNVCACAEGYTQSKNECTLASSGGQKEGLSTGAIVGILIGAVVIFIIVCCLVIFYIRKRVHSPQKNEKQSVENGAVRSESDDTSPNGAISTSSEDIAPGKKRDLLTLERKQEQMERSISDKKMVAFDETLNKEENVIPNDELSPDTEFRQPQLLSFDLNDIQMPVRACPYHMYRDDTAYASSLRFLTKDNVACNKTSEENKVPNEAVENEGNMLQLEASKSNQTAMINAALEHERQVIPNEMLIDEEIWKGDETLEAEKSILSNTILHKEAVVAGNKLRNEQNMMLAKTSRENKIPYEMLGNEENLTNFEVPVSNQIVTHERDLEHRGQVLHKETLMIKETLNRDETVETENSLLSDEALQIQGTADEMLKNEENITSDGIMKTADKRILGKTHQNEQNAIPDGLPKTSGMEMSGEIPRYRGIVIPIETPKTEDRLVPVIASQRELPSKQSPSLMTKSPENEVLSRAQARGQMHDQVALDETVDQGLPPLDTVFRPPHFTPCDLTDIHMPERASPNLMYQDDSAYHSFTDTGFRPPRFTSCSFSDIHIPERASPHHMYRDDSAYDSFEESLTPIETL